MSGNSEPSAPLSRLSVASSRSHLSSPDCTFHIMRTIVTCSCHVAAHLAVLPTPSPELHPASARIQTGYQPSPSDIYMQTQRQPLSSWDVLGPEETIPPVSTGSKRSYDSSFDSMITDMKKRRITPSYDSCECSALYTFCSHHYLGMAERLNSLINDSQLGTPSQPLDFNPRSVAVQIRTPEELAAVNDFLVTLGQDVAAGTRSQRNSQSQVLSDDFFDPINLSQLGLAGMPGVLGNNNYTESSYPTDVSHSYSANNSYPMGKSNNPSVPTTQYSAYGATSHPSSYQAPNDYVSHQNRRPIKQYAQTPNSSYSSRYHHPPSSLEINSPHSTASVPGTITPHTAISGNTAVFDYLRHPRGSTPVAHLAPVDYMTKTMRQVVPLRSAPGEALGRPEPVEPKLTQPVHRGPPARLTSLSSITSSSSIYPSLDMELDQYKLPPLNYRSSSPASRESTPSSTHSSPLSQHTVLPSLRSIASPAIGRSAVSEDLAKDVDKIEIGNHEISLEERRRHAALLRDMLVTINQEYQKQHGLPKQVSKLTEHQPEPPSSRDVEMAAV